MDVSPVMFSPGRARLVTRLRGSATQVKTMGIALVAFLAARDAGC
jgi:hypothetical protein